MDRQTSVTVKRFVKDLKKRMSINQLILFGSRARGDNFVNKISPSSSDRLRCDAAQIKNVYSALVKFAKKRNVAKLIQNFTEQRYHSQKILQIMALPS